MNSSYKKLIPLIISGLSLIALIGIAFLFFSNRTDYDWQGTNLTNFKAVKTLSLDQWPNYAVEQVFLSADNNLDYLSVAVKNNQNTNLVKFTLSSWPENFVIFETTKKIPAVAGYQYVEFKFPAISDSKGKVYKLTVNATDTKNFALATTTGDRYPDGRLFINNQQVDKILVFNFHYYKKNLYSLLLNRLPVYKPWIFQHSASFIVVFLMYGLLVMLVIYFLTKSTLTE